MIAVRHNNSVINSLFFVNSWVIIIFVIIDRCSVAWLTFFCMHSTTAHGHWEPGPSNQMVEENIMHNISQWFWTQTESMSLHLRLSPDYCPTPTLCFNRKYITSHWEAMVVFEGTFKSTKHNCGLNTRGPMSKHAFHTDSSDAGTAWTVHFLVSSKLTCWPLLQTSALLSFAKGGIQPSAPSTSVFRGFMFFWLALNLSDRGKKSIIMAKCKYFNSWPAPALAAACEWM